MDVRFKHARSEPAHTDRQTLTAVRCVQDSFPAIINFWALFSLLCLSRRKHKWLPRIQTFPAGAKAAGCHTGRDWDNQNFYERALA